MDPNPAIPLGFVIFAAFTTLAFIVMLVIIIRVAMRSRRVLRDAGLDPLAATAQLATRFAQGPMMTATKTVEQRLADIEDLYTRGLITTEERSSARTSALAEG